MVGLTTRDHAPPEVVVALVTALKLVAAKGSASKLTVSPGLLLETLPDRVTLLPKTTTGRETEIVTDAGFDAVAAAATSIAVARPARNTIVLLMGTPLSCLRRNEGLPR